MRKLIVLGVIATLCLFGRAYAAEDNVNTDKSCAETNTCTNSDKPTFDQCGNEYDSAGNLISRGTGCDTTVQPTIAIPSAPQSTSQTVDETPPAQPTFTGK